MWDGAFPQDYLVYYFFYFPNLTEQKTSENIQYFRQFLQIANTIRIYYSKWIQHLAIISRMQADEYTPSEQNIWKLYRSGRGRHSFNIFCSKHQSFTFMLQHIVDTYVLCISESPSFKIRGAHQVRSVLQVQGFP